MSLRRLRWSTAMAGLLLAAVSLWASVSRADSPGSAAEALRSDIAYLASEELAGRLTGSDGAKRAGDFIAQRLEAIGAIPLPGYDDLFQPFEFTSGSRDTGSSISIDGAEGHDDTRFEGQELIRALAFSDVGQATGSVVFAGYGLVLPDGQDSAYDSYHGLDVQDKIVLVLRYSPEDTEGELRANLSRYSGLRYKAMLARERGAQALLVVSGPRSANAGETVPLTFDAALSGSGIVAASISGEVADVILARADKSLADVQASLDDANPHVTGFEIPGAQLDLDVQVEREHQVGRNVIGVLPASAGVAVAGGDAVLLGAHYDHLGQGRHGGSLARKEEAGRVHPGADDNASGVAAVLAIGAELSQRELLRPVVLAFWSGEEIGLRGSTEFARSELVTDGRIRAYLNFDMVGRMEDNRLSLQAMGSSSVWPRLIEQANVPVGFDVRTQEDPYLPTDALALYLAGVPSLALFTGAHMDYHRPTDVATSINYEDLERVTQFAALVARKLDRMEEDPDYVKVQRGPARAGSRDGMRAYTGTIPDYTTEVEGVRLGGVSAGGPADSAGLRAGDVIVEFAGQAIKSIYDYTYALDAVKIGAPVTVVCLRQGERVESTITPTARP